MGKKRREQVTGKTYEERVKASQGFVKRFRNKIKARGFRGFANNSRDGKNIRR